MKPAWLLALALLASGCAITEENAPVPAGAEASPAAALLLRSSPAAGATIGAPDELLLVFDRPVALAEVIVEGPDGAMPMMLSSAGARSRYVLPLHGLGPGNYEVRWRTGGAAPREGGFRFTIR